MRSSALQAKDDEGGDRFFVIWFHFLFRHLLEQYFTSSKTFSHFFRHEKGLLHFMQIFCGKFSFLIPLGTLNSKFIFENKNLKSSLKAYLRQSKHLQFLILKPNLLLRPRHFFGQKIFHHLLHQARHKASDVVRCKRLL